MERELLFWLVFEDFALQKGQDILLLLLLLQYVTEYDCKKNLLKDIDGLHMNIIVYHSFETQYNFVIFVQICHF